ncbi:41023_t:CDS:1, partial [Gigaspora margarita]
NQLQKRQCGKVLNYLPPLQCGTKQRQDEETPKWLKKKSGSLITSLPAKQNYNEESAPKTSSGK